MPLPDFQHPIQGESSRAFSAFVKYRDLGPLRSLDAVAAIGAAPGKAKGRASGTYSRWSGRFAWVDRAAAYDVHFEDARMRAHEQHVQALERRRAEFEFRNQQELEEHVTLVNQILRKFESAPVTDITQDTTETVGRAVTRKRSKVKGINGSGFAALLRARNETARQAIVGVRPVDDEKNPTGEKNVDGIVWERREAT